MFSLRDSRSDDGLLSSRLFNQDDFYDSFKDDLLKAKREVIIESSFVSYKRLNYLLPIFRQLVQRKVRIIINTKPLEEQDSDYSWQAEKCIAVLQELGVEVLITGGHKYFHSEFL